MKYIYRKILIISILLTSYSAFAQLSKVWENRYQEVGYSDDTAKDIIVDTDGNSYVLGNTDDDGLILKYAADGSLLWSFQAGRGFFMEDSYEATRDFKIDHAGNVYVLLRGYREELYDVSSYGLLILKLDTEGQLVWQQFISGTFENGKGSLAVNDDGSLFILNRYDFRKIQLLSLTNEGDITWSKIFTVQDASYVQEVKIINNQVVVWYHSGLQTYIRRSYLHIYNPDGTLVWEHDYKYGSHGTHITGIQYHSGELITSYYMNLGNNSAFNQVVRYDMSDGTIIGSFDVQMDNIFESDDPISAMYVGDDSHVYLMGEQFLKVTKYSLGGERIWFYEYDRVIGLRHTVIDFVVNESDSSADVLLKTNDILTSQTDVYNVVKFNADKSTVLLTSVVTYQDLAVPVAFTETESNIYVAGAFDNGAFKKDLMVAKFTKTDTTFLWNSTFEPSNTEQHEPTCMAADEHGNVYVAGRLSVEDNVNGFGVIKYSPTGEQMWSAKFAPDDKFSGPSRRTLITAMTITSEGDIVVTGAVQLRNGGFSGTIRSDSMYTVKINSNGDIIWTAKTFNSDDGNIIGLQVIHDDDNNTYTLGSSCQNEMLLVKHDSDGNQLWERRFSNSCYTDLTNTGPDSHRPQMKIVNNEIYIASEGYVGFKVLELRKFDVDGNETLLKQFGNNEDDYTTFFTHDLHVDPIGNIYLLHGENKSTQNYSDDLFVSVSKLSSSGEVLWSQTWDYGYDDSIFPRDAKMAFDASNNIYVAKASASQLTYSKINASGAEVWNKSESLRGYQHSFGNPVFVFVKEDDNPVFISTNQDYQESKYYFIAVRDQNTGEITDSQTFDKIYDTNGTLSGTRPGDQVTSFVKSPSSDDFFISGVIMDKARSSETIVMLKYEVGPDIVPPSVPINLTVANSKEGVLLNWEPSSDNKNELVGYKIYKNQSLIGQVTDTVFIDDNVSCEQNYMYHITSIDLDGNESPSSNVVNYFERCPQIILSVSGDIEQGVQFNWELLFDNDDELGTYNIYKNQSLIGQVTDTVFIDDNVSCEESYLYYVSAINTNGSAPVVSNSVNYFESCPEVITSVNNNVLSGIDIYPNPANSVVNIEGNYIIRSLELVSMSGISVLNSYPNSNNFDLSIEDIQPGVYHLILHADNKIINKKLIIK